MIESNVDIAFLVAAGLIGGIVNVAAGGAKLFVFPLLTSLGLPPLAANATATVALWPSTLPGALGKQKAPQQTKVADVVEIAIAVVGGLIGVALLVGLGESVFVSVVPVFLILALLAIAFGDRISAVGETGRLVQSQSARRVLVGVCGVYAGYFGAGLGFLLMASMLMSGIREMHLAVRKKNILAVVANTAAVAPLAISGLVDWTAAALVFVSAVLGASLGATVLPKISPIVLKRLVLSAGTVLVARFLYF